MNDTFRPREYFHIAVVTGAHGIKGELKAKPLSDETTLDSLQDAYLLDPGDRNPRPVHIRAKLHKGLYIVSMDGIRDRDQAEKLRGHYLAMAREDAPELPDGRYYAADLIGCLVKTTEHGEIGTLLDTISGTGADIFEVKRPGKKDLLVPILDDTLVDVDLEARQIVLKLAEGLWEIYE